MHHHLMFDDDHDTSIDSNPLHGRTEQSSTTEHQMACHLTSAEEKEVEEHFPTAPLGDDIWMEKPVPDRHLCIHELSQPCVLCPYPCPCGLDQPHPAPEYAPTPQYMDLRNIFNFPDVMTTANNEDIPSLEDVLEL